jgi:ribokinase
MDKNPPRICVVGSANIDLTFRTTRLPRPGETLAGTAWQLGFGGKGANQAVMAAQLGARVAMIAKIGRDAFGEQTLQNFQAHGIDATHVTTAEGRSTGAASIVVDDEARNAILVVPGANLDLSPQDIHRAATIIQSAAILLCQLEVPVDTTLEAFRTAKSVGVKTILNPAPASRLPDELLRLADLCVPNEIEIEQLIGRPATSLEQAEQTARLLLQRGPGAVIVTLGERGALLVQSNAVEHIPAVPVRAVDTSGAGDAFIGALAVFLAEDIPLLDAIRRANHVAALSVARLGTQTSFPARAEADASWEDQS